MPESPVLVAMDMFLMANGEWLMSYGELVEHRTLNTERPTLNDFVGVKSGVCK